MGSPCLFTRQQALKMGYFYWVRVKSLNHLHTELNLGYLKGTKFCIESKASFIDITSIASFKIGRAHERVAKSEFKSEAILQGFLRASSPDSSRRIGSLSNWLFAARACAPKCEPACRLTSTVTSYFYCIFIMFIS